MPHDEQRATAVVGQHCLHVRRTGPYRRGVVQARGSAASVNAPEIPRSTRWRLPMAKLICCDSRRTASRKRSPSRHASAASVQIIARVPAAVRHDAGAVALQQSMRRPVAHRERRLSGRSRSYPQIFLFQGERVCLRRCSVFRYGTMQH